MQKLARDEFKRYQKGKGSEIDQCAVLEANLQSHGGSPAEAWNDNWQGVYALAEAVMKRIEKDGIV